MFIKKPVNDNIVAYHNRNARESMPLGAMKKKTPKAGRWKPKKPANSSTVVFSLIGRCQGEVHEVRALGLKLAQEAIQDGNKELAERIVARVKDLPYEYERQKRKEELVKRIEYLKKLAKR